MWIIAGDAAHAADPPAAPVADDNDCIVAVLHDDDTILGNASDSATCKVQQVWDLHRPLQ